MHSKPQDADVLRGLLVGWVTVQPRKTNECVFGREFRIGTSGSDGKDAVCGGEDDSIRDQSGSTWAIGRNHVAHTLHVRNGCQRASM